MSFNQNSNGDANPFRDSVPECRWVSQCHLLLEPHGCDHCDHNNPESAARRGRRASPRYHSPGAPLILLHMGKIARTFRLNFLLPQPMHSPIRLLRISRPFQRRLCVGAPGVHREQSASARRGKALSRLSDPSYFEKRSGKSGQWPPAFRRLPLHSHCPHLRRGRRHRCLSLPAQ